MVLDKKKFSFFWWPVPFFFTLKKGRYQNIIICPSAFHFFFSSKDFFFWKDRAFSLIFLPLIFHPYFILELTLSPFSTNLFPPFHIFTYHISHIHPYTSLITLFKKHPQNILTKKYQNTKNKKNTKTKNTSNNIS